jgi:hypothetical protein
VTILNDDLLLPPIANRTINEGQLLTLVASNNAAVIGSAFTLTDFEGFTNGTANGAVLFRDPRNSGTTLNYLSTTPNLSLVTNSFPAGNGSSRALRVNWSFAPGSVDAWLRLSTFNTTFLPNPVVPFNQSIRFDMFTDKPLKVGLGLRENNTTAAIGADGGGAAGNVEFIGVSSTIGNTPVPTRTIPSNTWTTVQFDMPFEAVSGLNGNGILESTTGKGVLDHLALVPDAGLGPYNVYLDNFIVFSNRFLYSLETNAPAGAFIHPVSGVFSWTPLETQGPGVYSITVRISDTTSALFDTKTFNVTVVETNNAPILGAITNQTIAEGATLLVTNLATDTDLPPNILTFSLTNPPAGATINPTNGLFSWTPSELQGPSTNVVTVRVTDNGTPPLSDQKSFTVVVTEVNTAPSLPGVADRWLHVGSTLRITNSASDPDLPANSLTYFLGSAPAGASLGATSGILTWTPTFQLGTNAFTVRVTDNGVPPLTNSISFKAIVVARPVILSMQLSASNVAVLWSAAPGVTYELQYKDELSNSNWISLAPPVTASGFTAGRSDAVTTRRFYRVHVLP